jgi:hypothetical protein
VSSIISSISGQFSKSLIQGTLLPVVFFVALSLAFVVPLLPSGGPMLSALQAVDAEWKVVAISLLTVVMSGALYSLNTLIIRFYEGYLWSESWLGKRWKAYYQREIIAARARYNGMWTLLRTARNLPGLDAAVQAQLGRVKDVWDKLGRRIVNESPVEPGLILPTRLGNVIRSFEYYPDRTYGMDAVTLWPRLIAQLDKDYAAVIDDAKTSFDFMINCAVLGAALSTTILVAGVARATPLATLATTMSWAAEVIGCAFVSYLSYLAAIPRAMAWGNVVKSAFDLFRRDLMKQLGYSSAFCTRHEEWEQWSEISRQMIYGDSPVALFAAPAVATYARGIPGSAPLEVARGVESQGNCVYIVLRIKNPDPHHEVASVVVTDTLPEGHYLDWSSPHVCGRPVRSRGSNPYHFEIGCLPANTGVVLRYRAVCLPPCDASSAARSS